MHQHFVIETKDTEVREILEVTLREVNELWHNANLPKYIQFGKDERGVNSHAMDGPTVEAVLCKPELLTKTIDIMRPVYDLLESHGLTPELTAEAEAGTPPSEMPPPQAQAAADGKAKGKGKRKSAQPTKKKKRGKKKRGVAFDDDDDDDDDEAAAAAAAAEAAEEAVPPLQAQNSRGRLRRSKDLMTKQSRGAGTKKVNSMWVSLHGVHFFCPS